MADNEVKAVATLDDKISPGLQKIENEAKKTSNSVANFAQNITRAFTSQSGATQSATKGMDLLSGSAGKAGVAMGGVLVAVGALAIALQQLHKLVDKTSDAYLKSTHNLAQESRVMKELNEQIKKNDEEIGRRTVQWTLFWKRQEEAASDFLVKFSMLFPGPPNNGGFRRGATGGSGAGGVSGAGYFDNAPVGPPFADAATREQAERRWREEQDREAERARRSAPPPFWNDNANPWATARASTFRAGRRRAGRDRLTEPDPIDLPNTTDPWEKINKEVEDMQKQAEMATQQISGAFQGMFSIILSGSKDMGAQLEQYFKQLVADILSRLAAQAISKSIVGALIPGAGLVVSSNSTIAVGPAALSANRQSLSYNSARGR